MNAGQSVSQSTGYIRIEVYIDFSSHKIGRIVLIVLKTLRQSTAIRKITSKLVGLS